MLAERAVLPLLLQLLSPKNELINVFPNNKIPQLPRNKNLTPSRTRVPLVVAAQLLNPTNAH